MPDRHANTIHMKRFLLKTIRTCAATAMLAMTAFGANAQKETTGEDFYYHDPFENETTDYVVDFENGLFGNRKPWDAENPEQGYRYIMTGPQSFVDVLQKMVDTFNYYYVRYGDLAQALQSFRQSEADFKATESQMTQGYLGDVDQLTSTLGKVLEGYGAIFEDIQKTVNSMSRAPRRTRGESFSAGLYDMGFYLEWIGDEYENALDWMQDIDNDYVEIQGEANEAGLEAVDFLGRYDKYVRSKVNMYSDLLDFYNANKASIFDQSTDLLATYVSVLNAEVNEINETVAGIDRDPFDYLRNLIGWLGTHIESMQSSMDEMKEEIEDWKANFEENNVPMLPNWLTFGSEKMPANWGLVPNIIARNGTFTIPTAVWTGNERNDVAILMSNILQPVYENGEEVTYCRRVEIPKDLVIVGNGAFPVNGIEEVEVYRVIESPEHAIILFEDSFTPSVFENATLIVPDGTAELYAQAEGWKLFKHIVQASDAAVEGIAADTVSVNVAGGVLTVSGTRGENVAVYTVGGVAVYNGAEGSVTLPGKGIYVVRVGNRQYKVAA